MRGCEWVYILLGCTRLQGAPMGNDCGCALVDRAVARVCPLVKVRPRWARTRANGRGWVGPGADWWERARTHGTERGLFARPRLRAYTHWAQMQVNRCGRIGPGADWWERTRTPGVDAWDQARTLRTSATATHTRRAQMQVNGRGRVGPGSNIVSSCERKAIHVQPLQWGHVSGHGRV
jgi:hypothetical protein